MLYVTLQKVSSCKWSLVICEMSLCTSTIMTEGRSHACNCIYLHGPFPFFWDEILYLLRCLSSQRHHELLSFTSFWDQYCVLKGSMDKESVCICIYLSIWAYCCPEMEVLTTLHFQRLLMFVLCLSHHASGCFVSLFTFANLVEKQLSKHKNLGFSGVLLTRVISELTSLTSSTANLRKGLE